jgi:hypothetical protein
MEDEKEDELVELTKVQGEFEAQVLKGMLESEGIEAAIRAGISQSIVPLTVDGLGEAKVFVHRKDLVRAEAVIEDYRGHE